MRTTCRAAIALCAALAACCNTPAGSGHDASTGSGSDGGGEPSDSGTIPILPVDAGTACSPACVAPKFCSSAATCLAPGSCASDGDCPTGMVCTLDTDTCVPGSQCGSTRITTQDVPPNLLIVLDRSCSMRDAVGTATKWQIAVAALDELTATYQGKVRFGLTLFPDTDKDKCHMGAIPLPVAPGNEPAIQELLDTSLSPDAGYYPDGPCVTPIDTAMEQAAGEPAFGDTSRHSFALLMTDGAQAGCSNDGGVLGDPVTVATITAMQHKGVDTFVVGFGSGVDKVALNSFAQAGGEGRTSTTHYYDASDQATLTAAFTAIAKQTLGCLIKLDSKPPDASKLFVFFNKTTLATRDPNHLDGWDYDDTNNQITFYGQVCSDLKDGTISTVDVVFGCARPPIN
jgi:predicted small secreted protein